MHQLIELLCHGGAVVVASAGAKPVRELGHPRRTLFEPRHQSLDLYRADREFLEKIDRLAPAPLEAGRQSTFP